MTQSEKRSATLNLNNLYVSKNHPQYDATVKHITETLQAVINTNLPYKGATFSTLKSKLTQGDENEVNFSEVSGGACLLDYMNCKHFTDNTPTDDIPFTYEYRLGGSISPTISVYSYRKITGVMTPGMDVVILICEYKDVVVPEQGVCEETSAQIDGRSYNFTSRSVTVEEFKIEWQV
jgi:hypothetical protein